MLCVQQFIVQLMPVLTMSSTRASVSCYVGRRWIFAETEMRAGCKEEPAGA